jgi:hypothetical protein
MMHVTGQRHRLAAAYLRFFPSQPFETFIHAGDGFTYGYGKFALNFSNRRMRGPRLGCSGLVIALDPSVPLGGGTDSSNADLS